MYVFCLIYTMLFYMYKTNRPWSFCLQIPSQTIHCQVPHRYNEPNPGDHLSPETYTHNSSVQLATTTTITTSAQPIPRPGHDYAPLPHHRWLSIVHGCPTWRSGLSCCHCPYLEQSTPSVSVFRGCLRAFLFRHSFPWSRYRNFCSACTVNVAIFGHINGSFYFYLLTYLLTYYDDDDDDDDDHFHYIM